MRLLKIMLCLVVFLGFTMSAEAANNRIKVSQIELRNGGYMTVVYPQVRGLYSEKAQNNINAVIRARVQKSIAEVQDANLATPLQAAEVKCSLNYDGGDNCSFILSQYISIKNGAHPQIKAYGLNFNKNNGNELILSDLQNLTLEDANKGLFKHLKAQNMPTEGIAGLSKVPQEFYINVDGDIVLILQAGEELPYAYRMVEFKPF